MKILGEGSIKRKIEVESKMCGSEKKRMENL